MLIVGAARELEEELGVEAINLRLVKTQAEWVDGGVWIGYFFEADAIGRPEIMEPHKHDEIAWFTSEELRERDAHPEWEVAAELEGR
jgi:ADP-ribose pyrophosphatase YjhB (NUDIX family)